jgi:hypothetical protein
MIVADMDDLGQIAFHGLTRPPVRPLAWTA